MWRITCCVLLLIVSFESVIRFNRVVVDVLPANLNARESVQFYLRQQPSIFIKPPHYHITVECFVLMTRILNLMAKRLRLIIDTLCTGTNWKLQQWVLMENWIKTVYANHLPIAGLRVLPVSFSGIGNKRHQSAIWLTDLSIQAAEYRLNPLTTTDLLHGCATPILRQFDRYYGATLLGVE